MAKVAREQALREKRSLKQEKKDAKKQAASQGLQDPEGIDGLTEADPLPRSPALEAGGAPLPGV